MTVTYGLATGRSTRTLLRACPRAARAAVALLAVFAGACAGSPSEAAPAEHLTAGTWGAEGAGVIVSDTLVHVHIGCTKGDFARPAALDGGRFNVAGRYILRLFPIQVGPELPARFTGVVRGRLLTLAIAVDDTVQKQLVALGPVTVVLGDEPRLGPCPICASPNRLAARPVMPFPARQAHGH
ncbi:MAG TPA: hypothetical protein VFV33_16365 [Gemmatimonadaceae bacterium]|nr:hypothetical protein [Gemmatimonadaceae bacterium]